LNDIVAIVGITAGLVTVISSTVIVTLGIAGLRKDIAVIRTELREFVRRLEKVEKQYETATGLKPPAATW